MNPRLKKLIATIALVILVALYAIVSTAIAVARLGDSGPLVHLAYYLIGGVLWVVPAMLLIRWAERKPR
ncbi:DUF2842 domain-containing protein [Chelativorans composti]|jgi:Protein of unknown function (DUF2842).|uniref:DUF2842 domain-containing protein n=1 Tax=Chelativorans composti TaxID=768533 RepID=A0ABW5DFW5_9HYPH